MFCSGLTQDFCAKLASSIIRDGDLDLGKETSQPDLLDNFDLYFKAPVTGVTKLMESVV